MAKYQIFKHYRGTPEYVDFVPMDQWTPAEVDAHVQYMNDFADRLRESGEFVDSAALSPDGAFVRASGPDLSPEVRSPFPDSKDLVAGWMIIDVADWDRALALAAELSAAPGFQGAPINEWLEVRPYLGDDAH